MGQIDDSAGNDNELIFPVPYDIPPTNYFKQGKYKHFDIYNFKVLNWSHAINEEVLGHMSVYDKPSSDHPNVMGRFVFRCNPEVGISQVYVTL